MNNKVVILGVSGVLGWLYWLTKKEPKFTFVGFYRADKKGIFKIDGKEYYLLAGQTMYLGGLSKWAIEFEEGLNDNSFAFNLLKDGVFEKNLKVFWPYS